jgi:cytochrome c553
MALSASAALPTQSIVTCALVTGVELRTALLQSSSSSFAGDVETGKELFIGKRRFQNGGPACAWCHSVATLPFPHGGTMAPDLTHEYSKLGPAGMHYALRTLYFPAMNALFLKHQLSEQEERDLSALFEDADSVERMNSQTGIFGGASVFGLLVLVGITWVSGRGRVHSVRRKLLRRAGLYREKR